jgi:hypothetical protein
MLQILKDSTSSTRIILQRNPKTYTSNKYILLEKPARPDDSYKVCNPDKPPARRMPGWWE